MLLLSPGMSPSCPQVLHACALDVDLEAMPRGMHASVGDQVGGRLQLSAACNLLHLPHNLRCHMHACDAAATVQLPL